jgi:hypothetical protein
LRGVSLTAARRIDGSHRRRWRRTVAWLISFGKPGRAMFVEF